MNVRRAVAAGTLAVAALVVAAALTGAVSASVEALVAAAGNDYVVAAALGVLGVLGAAVVALVRYRSGVEQAAFPDVEGVYGAPGFGSALDDYVERGDGDAERIRGRLHDLAVALDAGENGRTRSAARRRVAAGEWTGDRVAAAYVRGDSLPRTTRVFAALRGLSADRYGARRTARVLDERVATDGGRE